MDIAIAMQILAGALNEIGHSSPRYERSAEAFDAVAAELARLSARVAVAAVAPCSCCGGDPATVCDACGQHSCWAGVFMCENSRTAGIRQRTDAS